MELHDVDQWRRTVAMAPPAQTQMLELLDDIAHVVRERNELRRNLATVGELLSQVRSPWINVRALLNELQRTVGSLG